MPADLAKLIKDLYKEGVLREVKARAEVGKGVLETLEDCRQGMNAVSDAFKKGESFLRNQYFQGLPQNYR